MAPFLSLFFKGLFVSVVPMLGKFSTTEPHFQPLAVKLCFVNYYKTWCQVGAVAGLVV